MSRWMGWHSALGRIWSLGQQSSIRDVLDALRCLLSYDAALFVAYHGDGRPNILFRDLDKGWRRDTSDAYVGGAYRLDPFFELASHGASDGIYRLRDIAPEVSGSAYYARYFAGANVGDEVNLFATAPSGTTLALALQKPASAGLFDDGELSDLRDVGPLIIEVMRGVAEARTLPDAYGPDRLQPELQRAMDGFGTSLLTPRQLEILKLLLRGYETFGIAERLSISVETVKVHKKNIYEKLDVRSHTGLFPLFFDALRYATQVPDDGDILAAYLSKPGHSHERAARHLSA